MSERAIQNEGRNALAGLCLCFRAQVGTAWTGDNAEKITRDTVVRVRPGDVVIRNARPFSTGLPPGFHDTFGVVTETITQDMVGKQFGRFFTVEYKDAKGRVTDGQDAFRKAILRAGGRSGIARSAQEAVAIVTGRTP